MGSIVVFGLSAVTATLLAATIGAIAGVGGSVAGHLVSARLDRRRAREAQQLDDLLRIQDTLARLNRVHYKVFGHWRQTASEVPAELAEAYAGARAEALALNERIVDEALRRSVESFRESVAIRPVEDQVDRVQQHAVENYERVQRALGVAIRRWLA